MQRDLCYFIFVSLKFLWISFWPPKLCIINQNQLLYSSFFDEVNLELLHVPTQSGSAYLFACLHIFSGSSSKSTQEDLTPFFSILKSYSNKFGILYNIKSTILSNSAVFCQIFDTYAAVNFMSGSCQLDIASNVEIGTECQIFVIVIFLTAAEFYNLRHI